MKGYAKQKLKNAPLWISNLCKADGIATGYPVAERKHRTFITKAIQEEIDTNGVAVIKNVFSKALIKECARYVAIRHRGEGITKESYKQLSRNRYSVGLVTKCGWNKIDFAGLAQQALSASPNMIVCASELYNTNHLSANLYENKFNFGRPEEPNAFEFIHSGNRFL
jgi:hypothetical protein